MRALFDILAYSCSSVIWGILIAVVCMALFVFLIKGWYKDATFSPVSYIVGAVLFLFLSIQCILIVGSLKILDTTEVYEREISNIVDNNYDSTDEISVGQADNIIKTCIERFPLLRYYISGGEFFGFTARQLPNAIVGELQSFMLWYIFRRILWCLGFVIVGAVCVIRSMSKQYKSVRNRQAINTERRRIRRRPRS